MMPFKDRKKHQKRTNSGSSWWGATSGGSSSKKAPKKELLIFPAVTRQSTAIRTCTSKQKNKAQPTKQKQRQQSTQSKHDEKSMMDYMEEIVCSMCDWIEKTSVYYYSAYIFRPLTG